MKEFLETFKNKKILITGHTGFKGSWLSLWLKKLGADVTGISIDIPSVPSNFAATRLSSQVNSQFVDIRDNDSLQKVVNTIQPDFVFHLAAQALVRPSYSDPIKTMETNAMGTANILETLKCLNKKVVASMTTSYNAYVHFEWVRGYRDTDRIGGRDPD